MREMKIPYHPSERKRFDVSPDQISRERLRVLKTEYDRWHQRLPEIGIGFSLFGSLSKGKALMIETAALTDVDLHLFIDLDDVTTHAAELFVNGSDFARSRDYINRHQTDDETPINPNWDAVAHTIGSDLRERFYDRPNSIADLAVQDHPIQRRGPLSILGTVERYLEPDPYDAVDYFQLAAPWHLDVGGGLKPYRQAFLRELSSDRFTPNKRDKYWLTIAQAVAEVERYGQANIPETIRKHYPRTFDEAVQYYGLGQRA